MGGDNGEEDLEGWCVGLGGIEGGDGRTGVRDEWCVGWDGYNEGFMQGGDGM
jgi:hypothetical protein